MEQDKATKTTLIGGLLAAFAASVCCLGPLVLVSLGVGGAWISNLTLLEPFRPFFIGIALLCMILAYRKIFRAPAAQACAPGTLCASPKTNTAYRLMFYAVSLLVLIALAYPYLLTLYLSEY
jgi:mercuric ion transport protein